MFWFRRDLRIDMNNIGLNHALANSLPVLLIFIYDEEIVDSLSKKDTRVSFIYTNLKEIDLQLKDKQSSFLIQRGNIIERPHSKISY
jgi:deoxyribodipyrimidine photo-lyase